jgi:hypothetical protein
MSFWRTFGFHTVSAVETILDKEHFTLQQLLDEEEVLQEVKGQNKRLLSYMTSPAVLSQLIEYITVPAPENAELKRRFKFPFLSCEILCSEVWAICDALYADEALLDQLYDFLRKAPVPSADSEEVVLDPLLASYVCRTAGVLLQRKVGDTIAYLKRTNTIDALIAHLSNSSVMDLLLKVIASEETTEGAGVLQWLCETNLVESLVAKFSVRAGPDVHENASQALVDIVTVSSVLPDSPLMQQLESEAIVGKLFEFVLEGAELLSSPDATAKDKTDGSSALQSGLVVLNELVTRNGASQHVDTDDASTLPPPLQVTLRHLPRLVELLRAEALSPQATENSVRPPRFGFARLKVVDFLTAVSRSNYGIVEQQLASLEFFGLVVTLMSIHAWNNFLHGAVEQIFSAVLESDSPSLRRRLATEEAGVITRLLAAADKSAEEDAHPRGFRLGFMGHLIAIAAMFDAVAASDPEMQESLSAVPGWDDFAAGELAKARDIVSKPLGGHRPVAQPGDSSDEEGGFGGSSSDAGSMIFDQYQLGFTSTDFSVTEVGDDEDEDEEGGGLGGGAGGDEDEEDDEFAALATRAARPPGTDRHSSSGSEDEEAQADDWPSVPDNTE